MHSHQFSTSPNNDPSDNTPGCDGTVPEINPAFEAGKYLMNDPTPVSTEEAQEALLLLNKAGFAPQKLADTFGIPLENVPDIVVKNAKTTMQDFVSVVEETIRESVSNGLEVFEDDLQALITPLNPDVHSLLMLEASISMNDIPGVNEPASDDEIKAAADVLDNRGVDLRKAGIVYGILPERVPEYFARSMKGFSFFDSLDEKIDNVRDNEHPIFK